MREIRKTNWLYLVLIVAFLVISLGSGFLYQLVEDTMWGNCFLMVFPELLMLVIGIIYLKRVDKKKIWSSIRMHKLSPLTVFLVVVMGICLIPMVSLVNAISMMFATNLVESTMVNLSQYGFFGALFMIAIVPAFVEEFIYRGIFANTYMNYSYKKGVIVSALLFGLMHMNFNQFSYAFFIGIIFAIVLEVTDSILSSMILHFMINGSSVASYFLIVKMQGVLGGGEGNLDLASTEMTWAMVGAYVIPALIAAIIFFLILWGIGKSNGKIGAPKEEQSTKSGKIWSWQLTIATIICLIMAILVEVGSRLA